MIKKPVKKNRNGSTLIGFTVWLAAQATYSPLEPPYFFLFVRFIVIVDSSVQIYHFFIHLIFKGRAI